MPDSTSPHEILIQLPELLEWQFEVHTNPARFRVVCIGRQAGKTFFGVLQAIQCALNGGTVLWLSPTIRQSTIGWDLLCNILHQLRKVVPFTENKHEKAIRFGTFGGKIECRTADDPNNLRGFTLDLCVLDEAAFIKPEIWQVIKPALDIRQGKALFISTPYGKNWFYDLYNRGQDSTLNEWASWQLPSSVNPFLPDSAFEEAQKDGLCNFQAEYLAQFTTDGYSIFSNVATCIQSSELTEGIEGRDYVFGVDWGKQNDFTVISVMDRDSKELVNVERFNKIDYHLQRLKLITLADKFNPSRIICEENNVGSVNIEELKRIPKHGRYVESFTTTAQSKRKLIEALVLAFNKETIKLFYHPELMGELERFSAWMNQTTGNTTYSAPSGYHDDCVISLALAYRGTQPKYNNDFIVFDRSLLPL